MADEALAWPVARLVDAFRRRALSPVEVTESALARIAARDGALNAFITPFSESARAQAREAEQGYARGEQAPLLGVPVSVKDTFPLAGAVTTFGSALYREHVPRRDSGVVRRLRAAGAVFTGKTNTAEFGQSATTDNRLGDECRNPWDTTRTPGGSSGGAAASVAAGLSTVALGADGGGSIRIPAAFTGLFGIKPTPGLCRDEDGLRAMSAFVAPGPLARRVADARVMLGVLAERDYPRSPGPAGRRVAWCPRPEDHPVEPVVAEVLALALARMASNGYNVDEVAPPIDGWQAIFGPLVLDDEGRERGSLLDTGAADLTRYERSSLERARALDPAEVERANAALPGFRQRVDELFDDFDVLALPATASTAFPVGCRPERIAERKVSWLWGAFPFTAPFNVSGNPAASVPCALAGGLPVGLQLVARAGREDLLLDVCEDLEALFAFGYDGLDRRWSEASA